jgi:serine/threonine protein kinase
VDPNVVPMLDVVAEGGELFLVMEYVHGESLSELTSLARARGERIVLPVASAIVGGLLEGLHAAHDTGPNAGLAVAVPGDEARIGTGRGCHLLPFDPAVSRHHLTARRRARWDQPQVHPARNQEVRPPRARLAPARAAEA